MTLTYCVLIPTYNGDKALTEMVARLKAALDTPYPGWQLVLVDDMSPNDSSWKTTRELHQEHDNISSLRLLKNRGRSTAVICGMNFINENFPGSHVVIMDDDLQHRPEDVPRLFEAIGENPELDVVIAQFSHKQTSTLNKLGSWLKSRLDHSYYGLPKHLKFGPFIALNGRMVRPICSIKAQNPLIGSQILQIANNYHGVKCEHDKRRYGNPTFNFSRRFRLLLAIAFSDVSFLSKAFLIIGAVLCIASLVTGGFFLVSYFVAGSTINGWLSLILTVLFFGGVNVFGLSIIFRNIALIKNTADQMPAWSERDRNVAGNLRDRD